MYTRILNVIVKTKDIKSITQKANKLYIETYTADLVVKCKSIQSAKDTLDFLTSTVLDVNISIKETI